MKYFLLLLLFMSPAFTRGQAVIPVKWEYSIQKEDSTHFWLNIKAVIAPGWHIYSTRQPAGGPLKTTVSFTTSGGIKMVGELKEPVPIKRMEEVFDMEVWYFEDTAVFRQRFSSSEKSPVVKGKIMFMACTDERCLNPQTEIFRVPAISVSSPL